MNKSNNNPQNLTKQEINSLREKFIIKYAKEKGWDLNNLTTFQMLDIVSKKEYKSPKLKLS